MRRAKVVLGGTIAAGLGVAVAMHFAWDGAGRFVLDGRGPKTASNPRSTRDMSNGRIAFLPRT